MSERLQVVFTTMGVFVLGLLAGVLTQRMRPMPPPPIPPMGEFGLGPQGSFGPGQPPPAAPWMLGFGAGSPISLREMRTRIEELQPQIDAFRHNVDGIEDQFHKQLDLYLTLQQRNRLTALRSSMPHPPPLMPGCAGEMGDLFVPTVIYRPTLDRIAEVLKLNVTQRDQLKTLLIERRARMLALIDETPPPSFKLGSIFWQGGEAPSLTLDGDFGMAIRPRRKEFPPIIPRSAHPRGRTSQFHTWQLAHSPDPGLSFHRIQSPNHCSP